MQLHSGTLLWPHTAVVSGYPSVSESMECDLLIVGGGMSGALAAYAALETGMNIILLEKDRIGSGSSSANTGLLQYCSDKTLTSCIHSFGERQGVHFYELCRDAVNGIKQTIDKLGPGVEFNLRSSLYYASSREDVDPLHAEFETLCKYGFPAEWWNQADIESRFPFSKAGAIYTGGDAEVNPFQFVQELVRRAAANGVSVFERSPVADVHFPAPDLAVCRCGDYEIKARQMVIAAGYESQQFKKERGAFLTQSYVMVTEPASFLDQWHERCLIWESARPYLYLRTTAENRIIIGGLDEKLGPEGLDQTRYLRQAELLHRELENLFPEAAGLKGEFSWGAVFGQSRDGLPFIGRPPGLANCWFIEGFGGNGTVYSYIASRLLAKAIMGEMDPDLQLFALSRSPGQSQPM